MTLAAGGVQTTWDWGIIVKLGRREGEKRSVRDRSLGAVSDTFRNGGREEEIPNRADAIAEK